MAAEEILHILWRKRVSVLMVFVAVIGGVVALTLSLPDVYETKSYLLARPDRPSSTDFDTTQVSTTLNETYSELLRTRNFELEVSGRLPPELRDRLGSAVTIEPVPESQLISVRAEGPTPAAAKVLADTYAATAVTLAQRFSREEVTTGRMSVALQAPLPEAPSKPNKAIYIALGTMLAAIFAVGAGLLLNRFDQRLDVTLATNELFDVPVLARIPESSGRRLWLAEADDGGGSALGEAFRLLLTNLAFADLGGRPAAVAVLSPGPSEGKSLTSMWLGRASAELGLETLVVDADLRRPSLGNWLPDGQQGTHDGFSRALGRSSGTPADSAVPVDPWPHLNVLPSGPLVANPAALLGSRALAAFHQRATAAYDFVIYDTPPVAVGADASLIAAAVTAAIVVIDVRDADRRKVLQALDQISLTRVEVLGIVLNRVPPGAMPDAGDYYTWGKHPGALQRSGGR